MRKRSGKASTIRRAFVPTDPVEPRMERPFIEEGARRALAGV
jgi:hypothetical protein